MTTTNDLNNLNEDEQNAIKFLDNLACQIADGDITVDSYSVEPDYLDPYENDYTAKKLTMRFY